MKTAQKPAPAATTGKVAAAAKKPVSAKPAAVTHAVATKTAKPEATVGMKSPLAARMPVAGPAPTEAAKPITRPPVAKAASAPQATKSASVPPSPVPVAIAPAAEAPAARPAAPPPAPPERRMGPMDRIPPRQPSKAETFIEGDHVVYPTHGVGKVERIATEEIAGHKLELIHITFEENRMTLRVPVAKARSAGLRKLASRKLFDEAMAVLKGRARIKRTMWSRRAQEYEAKINSGDPLAIAEVVRDLHRNAGQPDQSFSERQIYEAAMDRLAAELAALDKTDKATAVTKLVDFLKTVA
jgi:CarD family transcriptional regulator